VVKEWLAWEQGRREGGKEASGVTSSVKTSESGVHGRGREGRKEGLRRSKQGTMECLLYVCSSTDEVRARRNRRNLKNNKTAPPKKKHTHTPKKKNEDSSISYMFLSLLIIKSTYLLLFDKLRLERRE
jgi:hypothetical protein